MLWFCAVKLPWLHAFNKIDAFLFVNLNDLMLCCFSTATMEFLAHFAEKLTAVGTECYSWIALNTIATADI